jgi:hypothetical protein
MVAPGWHRLSSEALAWHGLSSVGAQMAALMRDCRILVLAMITTWRWDRGDQLPNGLQLGTEWLSQIRTALERKELNIPG